MILSNFTQAPAAWQADLREDQIDGAQVKGQPRERYLHQFIHRTHVVRHCCSAVAEP